MLCESLFQFVYYRFCPPFCSAPYLPTSELSPKFCVVQKKKTKVPTTRLALFDAVLHGECGWNAVINNPLR